MKMKYVTDFFSNVFVLTALASWAEAQILKTLTYPSSERFVTSDGFTFGMPSASVTKADTKTKYSVLGLYIRPTTINVPF